MDLPQWENSYIPITTKCPILFYIAYQISQIFPRLMHFSIYLKCKRKMKKAIEEYKPDIIISVHSMYTCAISKLLKKQKIDIPFFVNVIDLVNPPNTWYDKDADALFVPTEEVKQNYIKKGFTDDIIVSGFPIRNDFQKRETPKEIKDYINILFVNPSVNLNKNIRFVKEVSKLENVKISFICGKDKKLYNTLLKKQNQGAISKDVKIFSFVNNMNEFLNEAHILLTKAGPNMMLEGARSATAIVVTGHIKGQENNNYEYVEKNNYGFKCENPNEIYSKLSEFIESRKLEECLKNVLNTDFNDGAKIIADYLIKKME